MFGDSSRQAEGSSDVLVVDGAVGQSDPALEARRQTPRPLVAGHQVHDAVRVEVLVAGQGDVVDRSGAEPAAQEGRDGRGLGEFVVTDDVGGYVPCSASWVTADAHRTATARKR